MRLKFILLLQFLAMSCFAGGKLDLSVGAYSLTAETSKSSGSESGPGAYQISYSYEVYDQIELAIGYTLLMSAVLSGDLGYGVDAMVHYFPFTPASEVRASSETGFMKVNHLWRPFVGLGFLQRQFQSVQNSYAGFGFIGGTERALDTSFDLKLFFRYASLSGSNDSTATEITVFGGLSFKF